MQKTIYVINPNSNPVVTAGIETAIARLRVAGGPAIECLTLAAGPLGIQSQYDVESVVLPLLELTRKLQPTAAAIVLACFSDPGLHAVREAMAQPAPTPVPVLGICESAALTALSMGGRFGVIAIMPTSIPRHLRNWGTMAILDRLAGEESIGMSVAELATGASTLERMIAAGQRLRDVKGADVIIMGCAGMAQFRAPLEQALGIPVVEPSQAATAMALGRALLNWHGGV